MKKYLYLLIICCSFFTDIFSQEIRIKRPFLAPLTEYYSGDKLIGNSTRQLAYFIENHSEDSLVIKQIMSSERLSEMYPKIYLYSAVTVGIGGVGLGYVFIKGIGSLYKLNNADLSLITVAKTSLGVMIIGLIGLNVAGGYFISSQIKLRKAIKGYNKPFQTDKVTLNLQPYFQPNASGLTISVNF